MIRSIAKYSTKKSVVVLQALLVERVQHGVAGAVGGGGGALHRGPSPIFCMWPPNGRW
jgi:hypothetical protein